MSISFTSSLQLKYSNFTNNTANNGGAVFGSFFNRTDISDSLFTNSHAYNGGALYLLQGLFVFMYNNLLANNFAKQLGSALMLSECDYVYILNTNAVQNFGG